MTSPESRFERAKEALSNPCNFCNSLCRIFAAPSVVFFSSSSSFFFSLFSLFLSDSRVTRASERAGSVCKIVFTFERLKETRRVSLASSLKFHFHLANSSSIRVPIYLNHTLSEINYLPRVYDALFTAEKKSRKQGMPRIRPIERGNFHIYLCNLLKINQYIYVLFIVG